MGVYQTQETPQTNHSAGNKLEMPQGAGCRQYNMPAAEGQPCILLYDGQHRAKHVSTKWDQHVQARNAGTTIYC